MCSTCLVQEARLHREGLVQELLIERLLGVVHHDDCHPVLVVLGAPCTTHHLQDVCDWEVHVAPASNRHRWHWGAGQACGTVRSRQSCMPKRLQARQRRMWLGSLTVFSSRCLQLQSPCRSCQQGAEEVPAAGSVELTGRSDGREDCRGCLPAMCRKAVIEGAVEQKEAMRGSQRAERGALAGLPLHYRSACCPYTKLCSQQAAVCQASCRAVHSFSPGRSIKILSAFDNHQVGRRVDAPGQGGGGHQDLKFRKEFRSPPSAALEGLRQGKWAGFGAANGPHTGCTTSKCTTPVAVQSPFCKGV